MKDKKLEQLRHSAAHLLAHAVTELFPTTTLTIGPATQEGFFYDLLPEKNFKEDDLIIIEQRMHEIAKRNVPITHEQMTKKEARELYKNNPFKLELIDQIPDDTVGIARQGNFYDLCKGGHVASTGDIKHFKLLNISGSYWRADRTKQALQRITGTAFLTEKDFKEYEKRRADALMYDHRRVGKEMDLFSFHDEGLGFPFFHPKGKRILNNLRNFLRQKLEAADYREIATPIMLTDELWKRSGHYAHYKENMFFSTIDEQQYAIRPMNCPGSILIYKNRPRSYRELPLRLAEFGLDHRYELSGVLHGLFRVRAFTQDDAHIYCTKEQIDQEIINCVNLAHDVLKRFNFSNISVDLSTKPAKAMGSEALWEQATNALKKALEKINLRYTVCEGEGAFYGPKIDFHIEDSIGRSWQCSTIQLDFFQPENFDLTYITPEGTKARPVMIHRAIFGSFERFLGVLIEHYKGKFPFWLAPVQVKILTITDEQKEYAQAILATLAQNGVSVEIDTSSDQISGQIKRAQQERVPWMLVLGKKEVENSTYTLRYLDGKQEFGLSLEQLLAKVDSALRSS
ncbi:MAG: threonine--tRNA ligase [bacterium]|nr:threonine--tRNA ligase [bacterium]